MKKINLVFLTLLTICFCNVCSGNTIGKFNFNAGWKFKRIENSNVQVSSFYDIDYDDSKWESVSLPHSAHIEPLVVNDQWQGVCWYRKNFSISENTKGKKIYIELEAAMNASQFWMNGIQVATHQGGYLPVIIDVTPFVKIGEDNVIAIRLDNTDNPVTGPKPLKILDFNMYGGLYRNAWLIVKNDLHISHPLLAQKVAGGGVFITFSKVSDTQSIVQIKTHLQNEGKSVKSVIVQNSVFYQGKLVIQKKSEIKTIDKGKDLEITEEIPINGAKLWSPASPNLYKLETKIFIDGNVVDKEENRFGIREYGFKDHDLYINGKKTFLTGVNRHQEYPFVGYALSDNAQYRDAKKIKEGGFDYIRLSHYPQSPAFLDACDELGLVVIDAILGWQYYADNDLFRQYCYRSAKELILRDRNHPCIMAWEVSLNETQMPVFFMEELNRIVHAEYPGKNVYSCGWMNEVYDIYLQARQHRLIHFTETQDKPYSVSEYGDWEYYSSNAGLNQHEYSKEERLEKSSRQLRSYGEQRLLQQATNIQESHNDNLSTPAYSDSYWVMYDYNRGYYDNLEASGVMDIFRLPKFSYFFFKSQREPALEIVLDIASYWTAQSSLNVRVFSNCDEVAFYLNDRLIAKQKPDQDAISNHLLHPPFTFKVPAYEKGTIKAIGYINGSPLLEQEVKTPQKASKLKVWLDESGRKPQSDCNDVLFLHIAAVDDQGTIVPDYSDEINVTLKGNASLLNVDAIKAEAGIATALIRINKSGKKVSVEAKSLNLNPGTLNFEVK